MKTYESDEIAQIADDLSVFADIGTDVPTTHKVDGGYAIKFVRLGEPTELIFTSLTDFISERIGETILKYSDVRALFASDRYGSLRNWAVNQKTFLETAATTNKEALTIYGHLNGGIEKLLSTDIDNLLAQDQPEGTSRILLIDGPAGIGKTHVIASLALDRARNYSRKRKPLVLHIQSRGKTLSFIYDLIAFSLQRLRIDATFDQIPILAKYGLVTIAIDGFDELADPEGYDLAWAQVSDLIESLRGNGSVILAGRETFIGRDRIVKDISAVRVGQDEVSVFTLLPPTKTEALNWLSNKGWIEAQLQIIEPFLEPNSLALRPFFLSTLSDPSIANRIATAQATNVLSILSEAMLDREVTKFGEAVERELSQSNLRTYVMNLMIEVARDMAENNSEAISEATLSWLVDVALPIEVSDPTRRILKARSQVLAFLANDDRKSYRKFYNEKFNDYFLSLALIQTVSNQESSKVMARGFFGAAFLETFGTILVNSTEAKVSANFLNNGLEVSRTAPLTDRTRRNIASLLLTGLSIADSIDGFELGAVEMDEARFAGTAAKSTLTDVVISQLDCRGGDIGKTTFSRCTVLTLIGDDATVLPDDFPEPSRVHDVGGARRTISDPLQVKEWIENHLLNPPTRENDLLPERLKNHEAIKLLEKACRSQNYWLRFSDDVYGNRILANSYWPIVEKALTDNNLLLVEYRQASGTDGRFIHVRQPSEILARNMSNIDVVALYADLVATLEPTTTT